MTAAPAITHIASGFLGVEMSLGDAFDVRALLVTGERYTLLIDTLARPADLAGVCAVVTERGRPLLIVNSHADWDHWWGNAAFPDAPVIAHRRTVVRQHKEGKRTLASMQRQEPAPFAGVELRPASVGFDGELDLDLGGITAQLRLLPGHTHDCLVVYFPQRRLLFAGDTAEEPFPLLNEGLIGDWPDRLRWWAERVKTVVPAHGSVTGPELLIRNADYLDGLRNEPAHEVPELQGATRFYRSAHHRNVRRAIKNAGK